MKKILLMALIFCGLYFTNNSVFGQIGYSFNASGTGNGIKTGELRLPISNQSNFTYEFWAKRSSTVANVNFATIVVNASGTNIIAGGFGVESDRMVVSLFNDYSPQTESNVIPANTAGVWHHYAYVFNQGEWFFYFDGALIGGNIPDVEGNLQIPDYNSYGPTYFTIGNRNPTDAVHLNFDGSIDDVRIWNSARTGSQILNGKNTELTGTQPGLIAYYKLNEQAGQTVFDSGSSNLDGVRGATSAVEILDPTINVAGIVTGTPVTTTAAATVITSSTATLNGSTNDNGLLTTLTFDYGTSPTLATSTSASASPSTINGGTGSRGTTAALSGLAASTTYYFRTRAVNSAGTALGSILNFTTPAPTLVVSPATLPTPVLGQVYSQSLSTTGGATPYTYTVPANTLPPGLSLASDGTLSGTATQTGTYNFTITSTDNNSVTVQKPYSLTVTGPTITAGGGALTAMNTTYGTASSPAQSFTVSGTGLTANLVIAPADAGFQVSTDNGVTYTSSATIIPSSGTISSTSIWVRLAANATVGSHSGNIVLSSTGATSVNVATVSSTVSAAPLTITADNQTKAYGAAVPTLTATYSGFVNGDTQASLTTLPVLSTSATAASSVAGSPYAITASGAASSNYSITYVPGTLSVTRAALTITVTNKTKVYGAAIPTLTATYAGFVNGDTPAGLTTVPTLSTSATAASSVAGSPYAITASGAASSNYSITYVPGTLTVTAAVLTITATNKTKVYGAALPTLTATYAGFVNGDTPAGLTTVPTLSTSATAASSVAGSPYAITASGAASSNYSITYVPGTLTVTAAALTITADNQTKAYGAALPALTASYAGFVNGDTPAGLTTPPTLSTSATAASSVAGSPYAITASGAVSSNYTISYVSGTLSVTAAPLTITADNQTKAYGAALPALTASYTGFVNGDTPAGLTTVPTLSTSATAASSVAGSPYAITASGAASSNYSITYVPGTLTVTRATLTITATNKTKVYGAAVPTLTITYAGFVNGDTPAGLTTPPTLSTSATAASSVAGSPYAITASGAASSNYSITYVPGTLTVTTAALTITATNKTKVYGAAVPTLTATYSGFVNGDTPAGLTTVPTLSTSATAASSVAGSPYAITASGAVSSNYSITYVPGTLTVTAAALTITADNQTKAYGAALPALTATYAGFVNGDTPAGLTTVPTLSTSATAASSVAGSPYAITASGAASSNYTISYAPGTLTVTAATLTITATNKTKVYGAAVPTLTATYAGFVNGDTPAGLTTVPTLSTAATAASSVAGSPYAITVSGAASSNYSITYVPGTLTVTAATLTITATNKTKAYGVAVPTLTATYAGFVNGDTPAGLTTPPTLSTAATAASSVAGSPYAITASGAVSSNYSITYVPGTLTVTAAALTITADNQTKAYGAALPALTASYAGFVNGDTPAGLTTPPTLSTSATAASSVAGSPYAITASGAISSNYSITYVPGTLTVTAAALTITANNQTKAYGAALPALTVTYTGFVNGDTPAGLTTVPVLSTTATAASSVAGSPYAITASGAASSNYSITYVPGTLTVTAATLTITATNKTKVYGAAVPTLTVTYAGFVNGDTPAGLTTPPTLSTAATAASSVAGSPYAITVSGAVSSNYSITYVPGTLTVTAAPLTITAINKTKAYGAAVPALTVSYAGFVNGDTPAGLTTPPTLSTSATAASSVAGSPYAITASGAVSSNYTITYVPGILTVTAIPLTITAENKTKAYGAALPALTASYSGFVNGDTNTDLTTQPVLSTTATAASTVAGSPYPITATGAVSSNYTISYVSGTLSVDAITLTITADNKSKVYGAALPVLTASYSGFVNGDTNISLTTQPVLSTTATAASTVAGSPYAITATGAVSANYNIVYAPGELTISAAPLTITAENKSKVYGAAVPTLTATYNGFVNGDTNASLTTQPALSTTATSASSVAGSPYAINVAGAASANYTISYTPGSLTVTAAPLIITADNKTKVFGAANPPLTASYSGFVNGDTNASLTTQPILSTTATTTSSSAGSPYPITVTGAVSSNYAISYVPGTLTVNNAVLTITANNQTKVYGTANPALTLSYSGFANGDSPASFTTAPVVSTTATAGSGVNTYPITVSGAVLASYNIVYVPGTLTVTPAPLTITAENKSRNFGTANPALTVTYSGFVNGDDVSKLASPATAATTANLLSLPGNYPITASGATSPNYSFNYVNGRLTINPLTLTALSNLSISSGTLSPAFSTGTNSYTASVSNNVNFISFVPTFDPTATAKINGTATPNGSPSTGITLTPGNNVITLVITAQDGVTSVTYTITVYKGKPASTITATNILTPNGDGKNDTWMIQDIELYPNNSVVIYDRAGRQVFSQRGYKNTWDATLRGSPLVEGTYFYTVDLGNGEPQFRGFITLLRSR